MLGTGPIKIGVGACATQLIFIMITFHPFLRLSTPVDIWRLVR